MVISVSFVFLQILKTLPFLTIESTADDGSHQLHDSSAPEAELLHSNNASNSAKSSSTKTSHNPNAFASGFLRLHTSCNSGSGCDPSEQNPPSSEVSCAPVQESVAHPVARLLSEYLEDQPDEHFEQYLLPKKFYRYFWVMDLTQKNSTNTCCFTKRSKVSAIELTKSKSKWK